MANFKLKIIIIISEVWSKHKEKYKKEKEGIVRASSRYAKWQQNRRIEANTRRVVDKEKNQIIAKGWIRVWLEEAKGKEGKIVDHNRAWEEYERRIVEEYEEIEEKKKGTIRCNRQWRVIAQEVRIKE